MSKKSVNTAIIIVLLLIVALVMIFIFGKNMPNVVTDILFPEKSRLVRYYACALAMCSKGCGDGMLSDPNNPEGFICLENDTETSDCALTCEDLCTSPGKKCGRDNYIRLELMDKGFLGGVPLKGVYDVSYGITLPKIVVRFQIIDLLPISVGTCNIKTDIKNMINAMKKGDYPTFPSPENIVSKTGLFGGIYDSTSNPKGEGAIFLDQGNARAAFGCYKELPYHDAWPIVGWSVSNTLCNGDYGYNQCKFQNELFFWATEKSPGEVDVTINSTLPEPGFFIIEADHSYWKGWWEGHEEVYGITIKNRLGTGSDFSISAEDLTPSVDLFSEPIGDPVCELSENSFWIDDGGDKLIELRCSVSVDDDRFFKKHTIKIDATTTGMPTQSIDVIFEIVDLKIDVRPGNPDPGFDDIKTVNKNVNANFITTVYGYFNEADTFNLDYIFTDYNTGDITTSVSCSLLPDTINVPAQNAGIPGMAQTTISCGSGDYGSYRITAVVSDDETDVDRRDSTRFNVVPPPCQCNGNACLSSDCAGCVSCGSGIGQGVCNYGTFYEIRDDDGDGYADTQFCCENENCDEKYCSYDDFLDTPVCNYQGECGLTGVPGLGICEASSEPCGGFVYKLNYGPVDGWIQCEEDCDAEFGCIGCGCRHFNDVEDGTLWDEDCCARSSPNCDVGKGYCAICEGSYPQTCICDEGTSKWVPGWITGLPYYTEKATEVPCCRKEDCPDWYCYEGAGIFYCQSTVIDIDGTCMPKSCNMNTNTCFLSGEAPFDFYDSLFDCTVGCQLKCLEVCGSIDMCDNSHTT